MTEIERYLLAPSPDGVDWAEYPWSAAYPVLAWLELAPRGLKVERSLPLDEASVMTLATAMYGRLCQEKVLAWSSHMLETGLGALRDACGGPPEALLKVVWEESKDRLLDSNYYEFCRALGRSILAAHRTETGWDLMWMLNPESDPQRCLMYWTLAVRPDLWTDEVEEATIASLERYPFPF